MKSFDVKKTIEVLPMKKGESLSNVKTKVSLSQIPKEFTINADNDVLFVLLNKQTGAYLGNIKIVYSKLDIEQWGVTFHKRIANVELSEFSPTIQDDVYSKVLNHLHNQARYGKYANYIQIDKKSLSERMDMIVYRSWFKTRRNPEIFEMNIEADVFLMLFIILICTPL